MATKYSPIDINYQAPVIQIPDMNTGAMANIAQLINTKLKVDQVKDARFQSAYGETDKFINHPWESREMADIADSLADQNNITMERLNSDEVTTPQGYRALLTDLMNMRMDPNWQKIKYTDTKLKEMKKQLDVVAQNTSPEYFNLLNDKIEQAKSHPLNVKLISELNPYSYIGTDINKILQEQDYSPDEIYTFDYDAEDESLVEYKQNKYDPIVVQDRIKSMLQQPGNLKTVKMNMELGLYRDADGNIINDLEDPKAWDYITEFHKRSVPLSSEIKILKSDTLSPRQKEERNRQEKQFYDSHGIRERTLDLQREKFIEEQSQHDDVQKIREREQTRKEKFTNWEMSRPPSSNRSLTAAEREAQYKSEQSEYIQKAFNRGVVDYNGGSPYITKSTFINEKGNMDITPVVHIRSYSDILKKYMPENATLEYKKAVDNIQPPSVSYIDLEQGFKDNTLGGGYRTIDETGTKTTASLNTERQIISNSFAVVNLKEEAVLKHLYNKYKDWVNNYNNNIGVIRKDPIKAERFPAGVTIGFDLKNKGAKVKTKINDDNELSVGDYTNGEMYIAYLDDNGNKIMKNPIIQISLQKDEDGVDYARVTLPLNIVR